VHAKAARRAQVSPVKCFFGSTAASDKTMGDFSAKDIDGNDVSLSKYVGKVCLIVNVASA